MLPLAHRMRPFTGLIAAGSVSLDLNTPTKSPPIPTQHSGKGNEAVRDLQKSEFKMDQKQPEHCKDFSILFGKSERSKAALTKLLTKIPDPKRFAVLVLDMDKFIFEDTEEADEVLKETIIVNNNSSLKDVIIRLAEKFHEGPQQDTNEGQAAENQASGQSPPESSPETKPLYSFMVKKAASPPAPGVLTARPDRQQKCLGNLNCGEGSEGYLKFLHRHVLQKRFELNHAGQEAYDKIVQDRISDPARTFTIFFEHDSPAYSYDDKTDICTALKSYPAISCVRYKEDDQISLCYFIGGCAPSYFKKNGHLKSPVRCRPLTLPPGVDPDHAVTLQKMLDLQAKFATQMIGLPPTDLDWRLADWRQRKYEYLRNNPGGRYPVPRPTGPPSEREAKYAEYKAALDAGTIGEIPDRVSKLFYRLPVFYFSAARDPLNRRNGVLAIGRLIRSVNANFVAPEDPTQIPGPNAAESSIAAESSNATRSPSTPQGTEFRFEREEGNEDTQEEDAYDLSLGLAHLLTAHASRFTPPGSRN